MPETQIIFFQDDRGEVPVLNWLKKLLKQDRKGYANCIARIEQLAEYGFELKRPAADFLRDGIYELRAKHVKVQYRLLYFFHGQNVVILAHAMIKEHKQVPEKEIELALKYKNLFVLKPENYTYTEPEEEANEEN
ncbi:type II toxin-antitoxin system RelE/ParE family toxin [Cuspidothrix issatschenkoi LEGE 03284]|jgi:phage-related protein|uniref:type II toxin-antitoxin system RelE/ParE family toxin n=1 Tax=Cuspidothrix issatschenkoi TaxID=230752 RepID=UPI00187EF7B5|nr:type II toxin-antitoxin system RelE/ParE family toxin [Cuspidothrix issatschenkoi]MBE9232073.1 type II toxin-antitoxin system RelE/ParE family toxin [Cuspidothrix issatschenkoi LEGE 03284]